MGIFFLLFSEPVIEAELTDVLSTAASGTTVTKNIFADTAVKLFRYWLDKSEGIATILCSVSDICYNHSDLSAVCEAKQHCKSSSGRNTIESREI